MPPQNTNAALLIAFEMICPVYFVKWKLVIVMETMCTSSMYFEFHFVSCKIEATDCNRGKVHLSLYLVFHFAKWRLLIVTEKRSTSPSGTWISCLLGLEPSGSWTTQVISPVEYFLWLLESIFSMNFLLQLTLMTFTSKLNFLIKSIRCKFLQRISITFFWWWWGSEVNREGHVLSLIFSFLCRCFIIFLKSQFCALVSLLFGTLI